MPIGIPFSGGSKPRLNKLKPPADAPDVSDFIELCSIKSGRKYAKAHLIDFFIQTALVTFCQAVFLLNRTHYI